jgi:hypothetical protein
MNLEEQFELHHENLKTEEENIRRISLQWVAGNSAEAVEYVTAKPFCRGDCSSAVSRLKT